MVTATVSYEEKRKQRLEENKKRMEELNLHKLSQALKPSPKTTTPVKKVKPKSVDFAVNTPPRRSSRTAEKPPPNYKEYPLENIVGGKRTYQRRDLLNRVYASHKDRVYAIERAENVESRLGSEFPTFIKPMLQSHVTGGFWLGLPHSFCKAHMPSEDTFFTLVDENGDNWIAKYLAAKNGLSGGWRGFSLDHDLVDGDALVFQLIKDETFKVYIIRVNSDEEDEDQGGD